ncbi:DUF4758 domain-containing protein [Trichonephila clavata]|uniref:DUF4758 domain-containing protein n=1 Tax=Trichonephila clavata TaxID=2740835 RepID=A0A8X6LPE4_TRICU|nr:DUF4758 domain-containing protein [Trichonephila clavata]
MSVFFHILTLLHFILILLPVLNRKPPLALSLAHCAAAQKVTSWDLEEISPSVLSVYAYAIDLFRSYISAKRVLSDVKVVPLWADGAAPVYIPTAPRAEALTAAEEIDADITLPTVTVRGFLNFRTTVDGTVIVFTPASGAPQDPTPASSTPSPASSAPPGTPISPRNDDIQHLTYTGDDRITRTELENEAHTPEDDRQNFRQRHLKLGYSDLGTTPHSPKNEEPQQNLHKPDATPQLPQYPTGLVTVLGGTHVKDGATTVFETKVIGTYIEGKYAQILQSTSQIIFAAKSEDLSTPKPSPTKPSFQKSATLAVTSSRPTPSKSNQILVEHSSSRQKPTGEPKEYRSTTPDREADRRTDEPLNANTVLHLPSSYPIMFPITVKRPDPRNPGKDSVQIIVQIVEEVPAHTGHGCPT